MGERLEDLMKSVLEDIKNQEYKQAYLFFGEEGYLKKQYRNKLLQAWNTMNESRFEGKGIDVKEVISLGETMPFFSDRRIILLENTGFFKNQCPELAEYLNNLPDYLYLLFVEEEVDKRSKMFKSVKQIGRVGDFAVQAGWLGPEVLVYMAFVSVAGFAQPSYELGYAFKLLRVALLLVTAAFDVWGFCLGVVGIFILLCTTKPLVGKGYLYPLVPFNGKALLRLLVREPISRDNT